nr:trypsin-like peptidase domain-containing protein [Ardenticatena sp.]
MRRYLAFAMLLIVVSGCAFQAGRARPTRGVQNVAAQVATPLRSPTMPPEATATMAPTHTPLPTPTPSPFAETPLPEETQSGAPPIDGVAVWKAQEAWLSDLYDRASRSVVHITTRTYTYDFFLRPIPQEGTGSGFMWDTEGHVVTNYHVVENAREIEVALADGTRTTASIVGVDPQNDLAVIKLDEVPDNAPPLPLGDSLSLRVGHFVIAIGNPFGFDRTMTLGIVSALGRVIQSESGTFIGEVIQTDAAINPGNSGGPLLDIEGRVVGVNSAIISPSGANAGIGFAIPAHTVKRVVPELIERGYYRHPWLGIEAFDLTPRLADALRRRGVAVPDEGVLVVAVYRGGPAANAGIRGATARVQIANLLLPVGGDVIVGVDGDPVTSLRDLNLLLENRYRVGDRVVLNIVRNGDPMDVEVILAERP